MLCPLIAIPIAQFVSTRRIGVPGGRHLWYIRIRDSRGIFTALFQRTLEKRTKSTTDFKDADDFPSISRLGGQFDGETLGIATGDRNGAELKHEARLQCHNRVTPVQDHSVRRLTNWSRNNLFEGVPFAFAMVGFSALRGGVNTVGAIQSGLNVGAKFPDVSGYFKSSWMHFGLWRLLDVASTPRAITYSLCLILLFLFLVWRFLDQNVSTMDRDLLFGFIALSPVLTILFLHLGIYDALFMVGAVLLVGSSNLFVMSMGATVLLGANFELGLLSLLALGVLSFSPETNLQTRHVIAASGVGLCVSLIALVGWYGNFIEGDSRSSWLWQHLRGSIVQFAVSFPLMVLSFYGVAWLLVGGFLLKSSDRRSLLLHLVALFAIPGLAAASTLDGTRVFVCASAPAFLAMAIRRESKLSSFLSSAISTRSLVALALLVPAVMVHFGTVKLPYQILYGRL